MTKKKKEEFRIDITDEYVDYFYNIQNRNQISTNVQVFRHCLETTEKLEQEAIRPASEIHPKLQFTSERYLSRSDVQLHFELNDIDDLVKRAVGNLIEEIEKFAKSRSLVHWDIRSSLTGEKHDVAVAFKQLHLESDDGTVRFDSLLSQLNWKDQNKLKEIMNEFSIQGLVQRENFGKQILFHAD